VQTPAYGVLADVPFGADVTRVDLQPNDYAAQIELHGKRLAWVRALRCPCRPTNNQTRQVDPNCRLCHGMTWTYFGPTSSQVLPEQTLTPAQQTLVKRQNAFVIRGLLMGLNKQDKPWDTIGAWRMGSASVTVRAGNCLGFSDRITNLDDRIVFSEVIDVAPDALAAKPLSLRYLVAGGVYMLRSEGRVLEAGRDFVVRQGGVHLLAPLPAADRRLAAHYVTFPTFLVQDIPNVSRETSVEDQDFGTQTGIGQSTQLPVRATLRLEFLPSAIDQDPQ
jgi:hypothetical protein